MMGTAFFSICLRTLLFQKIQKALGLMRTAVAGCCLTTVMHAARCSNTGCHPPCA